MKRIFAQFTKEIVQFQRDRLTLGLAFILPLQTSGVLAPIEAMPRFFQVLSLLNPLRHYIAIVRGILLKGVGLDVLWMHILALLSIAVVLLTISLSKFRNQLS
ncbi:ABC transporter permease [Nostoc commune]|uniref:ABC transporter permease n=1 Tax=Nostoc commune TaxID=1178 RepID=UPI0018C79152|nr:ABC transporter permease [Nostoc commune]MBG1261901.1 ABC transporter permease [Nostoc commune BAE]